MATQLLLIDTDVLIDYLRDYPEAVSYVEARPEHLFIFVVTVAEAQRQLSLVTLNQKHFPMLQDVIVSYHKTQHNAPPNTGMEPGR